jgi:hypothetical protein
MIFACLYKWRIGELFAEKKNVLGDTDKLLQMAH